MGQHYSDPKRASKIHALPNIETFQLTGPEARRVLTQWNDDDDDDLDACTDDELAGWFFWFCLPGCLPDSGPTGPFRTEAEALENMLETYGPDDDDDDANDDDDDNDNVGA